MPAHVHEAGEAVHFLLAELHVEATLWLHGCKHTLQPQLHLLHSLHHGLELCLHICCSVPLFVCEPLTHHYYSPPHIKTRLVHGGVVRVQRMGVA